MKKTYFAYIRVSTIKQGERGSSLQEQKSAIDAYAARNGLAIVGWFEEKETAAKQGRRQFTQMMSALAAHKAGGVIIHKIDRSARNLRDWANLGDLIDRGVDVRFVVDNFDLLSRGGRLSADIQAVVASDFIRNLRDEVKKGMYGRLKQGLYPWKAPMGYLDTGKGNVKVIDPVKGPLVRLMFERYATNTLGFHALRREMYERGLRTKRGKILPVNAIHLVLNNPFYIGVIRMGAGDTYPGIHEPLISKALFDRVQTILRSKSVPKSWKNRFLLRQMVKCGHCGRRTLTGELQKGTLYYRCHSHSCRGTSWRGDVLEGVVLDHIRRIRLLAEGQRDERDEISNTEPTHPPRGRGDGGTKITTMSALGDISDLRAMVDDVCKQQTGEAERFKHSRQLRLQQIDDRVARLTDLLIDEVIDRAIYNERKEQLLIDRKGILEEIGRAHGRSPLASLFDEFERNNTKLLHYELMTDDEKRELIDIVCSNFSVCGNNSTFTLRSPYREMSELNSFQFGAPNRNEVRTRKIFDVLKKIADGRTDGRSTSEISSPSSPHPPIGAGGSVRRGVIQTTPRRTRSAGA
jgi:site-specific DNA recombinase